MDSLPQQMLLQIILILLNGFFASSEIALLSLNTNKLKKHAENGDKNAIRLVHLIEEPSLFLSTIQIGITLAGFLGSAFAADNFSGYLVHFIYQDLGFTRFSLATLDTIAVIIITLILSYFTLIFGELVPKRIAMQKSYQLATIASKVINVVGFVMKPIVSFLSLSTNLVLRLLGMKTDANGESVTEEDIQLLVELGEETGILDEDESEWIQNVFAFDDTMVKEIMVHAIDVEAISLTNTEEEILEAMKHTGLSRFPVYKKDLNTIIGVLYTKDYLLASKKERENLEELLRSVYFVPENMVASDLFNDLQRNKIHFAVVSDEFGAVSGIITMEDLLEEIVGNIYDEHDTIEEGYIEKLNDTSWRVSGDCEIALLEEGIDPIFKENDEYDTVAGLIFSHLRKIPKDGAIFDIRINGYNFHVCKVKNRRLEEIIIRKIAA